MSRLSRFTGSPWHTEKMFRDHGDSRRHRAKCKHYNKETRHCSVIHSNCFGSAHCSYYKEGSYKGNKKSSGSRIPKVQRVDKYAQYNKNKIPKNYRRKVIRVGSEIKNASYGTGIVKSIYNGLAIVNFKNVGDVMIDMRDNSESGSLHTVEKKNGKYIKKDT